MSALKSVAIGVGHYLPEKIVTNEDLSKIVDTSHDWIYSRTGIAERRFAAEGELTSDLGTNAAQNAINFAGLKAQDIDLVICATVTPDQTFPATATRIQANLGITKGAAFDISAACGGYLYALATADAFIKAGRATNALIIGAETFSRILDMTDRRTCVLFGDGAGAVVLQGQQNSDSGVLSCDLHADGRFNDILHTTGGPSSTGSSGVVAMQGQEVYRHAVSKLVESAKQTLAAHQIKSTDITWMIPHQANIRIIDSVAKKLGLKDNQVIRTVERHANTSAASIPLALSEAVQAGHVKKGDLILHEAIGAGLVWGSALIKW
jgi:3-oxoacyl-[acyl-carrier-protein] synthase-3